MYGLVYSINNTSSTSTRLSNVDIVDFTSGIRVDLLGNSSLLVTNCVLNGNDLIASGGPSVGGAGIEVISGQAVTVTFCDISANRRYGVFVHGSSSNEKVSIQNSTIIGNDDAGVYLDNVDRPFDISDNDIRGSSLGPGIWIEESAHSADSLIEGNFIGDNAVAGVRLVDSSFPNLSIQNNWIGTDLTDADIGNGGEGIAGVNAELALIQANVIGFNGGSGIDLEQSQVVSITSNNIGTNTAILADSEYLGNGGHGISLRGTADTIIVANAIAFNAGDGIAIVDAPAGQGVAAHNIIASNEFWENAGLPIDLKNDGLTANDSGDEDPGPNALLNSPEILQNTLQLISGVWQATVNIDVDKTGTYAIQYYVFDPENNSYLFLTQSSIFSVNALISGPDHTRTISLANGAQVVAGEQIVAVLIGDSGDNENNTSEFSRPIILDVTAPRISNVLLDGAWTRNPYSFASIVPTGKQLAPIGTDGVNTIQIQFSEDVIVNSSALTLVGSTQSNGSLDVGLNVISSTNFSYDPVNFVGTWTFNNLPRDKYRIELSTAVVDEAGNALDGEWMNLTSGTNDIFSDDPTGRTFSANAGNGVPGGSFRFFFSLLPGDSNQDGIVSSADIAGTIADVDGDGDGDATDIGLINGNLINKSLPLRHRFDGTATSPTGEFTNHGDYIDDEIVSNSVSALDEQISDYQRWKTTYGSATMDADGNDNGAVDAGDYTVYANNRYDYSGWYLGALPESNPPSGSSFPEVDIAPQVINVTVGGSSSTHTSFSFDSIVGSGDQLGTVPVGGANTVSMTFSEPVNVSADMLRFQGLHFGERPELAEFSYDTDTQTASWRFTGISKGDHYLISLSDSITDVDGDRLDGEWVNPASIFTTNSAVSEFPSGDGNSGGDFNFVVTLLPGDADLDNLSDFSDFTILIVNYSMTGAEFIDADFNGNGTVDSDDYDLLLQNYGANLQALNLLADLDGDFDVDGDDADILFENWDNNLANPTPADGDLDDDGDLDLDDFDLLFAQFGLELSVVS
ncbi:MAG: right-handed parallel beta-helix repeat-containing protein [Pirellulales bacterium]